MTDVDGAVSDSSDSVGLVRAVVGLLQGLALYLLFDAFQAKGWAATHGPLLAALCTTAIFAPLVVTTGLTHLRLSRLAGWSLIVALVCAGLGYYDIVRDPVSPPATLRNLPSPQLWLALSFLLFVTQSLLVAGASDRRLVARYPTYFDVSWKYGVQILLAALFAGAFWLILWLGTELFKLIKIDFLAKLIEKNWFWIPATTLVLNYAVHVTDARAGIVRGVRTLGCNLLSWLLPLITLIVVGFVATLLVTGLQPLWSTRQASFILLAAAAGLVFLINATFQDGLRIDGGENNARPLSPLLRISLIVASIALAPLVLLAAYSLMLRVGQYGWTPDRVYAAASTAVAACYAIGYIIAVFRRRFLSSRLGITNVATACIALVVVLALFTPLADPARISVADQVARLSSGKTTADNFDYIFLRFSSGQYGMDALRKLAESGSAPAAEKAAQMLQWKTIYEARQRAPLPVQDLTRNITVVQPPGASLPPDFLTHDWSSTKNRYALPSCITGQVKCDAVLTDLNGDGIAEIILVLAPSSPGPSATVFALDDQKSWSYAGRLSNTHCPGVREAFLAGRIESVTSPFRELKVSGQRIFVVPDEGCAQDGSPK